MSDAKTAFDVLRNLVDDLIRLRKGVITEDEVELNDLHGLGGVVSFIEEEVKLICGPVSTTRYFTIEAVQLLDMDGDPNKGMSFIRYRPDDDPEKGYHNIMMPDEFARFAKAFGDDRQSCMDRSLARLRPRR